MVHHTLTEKEREAASLAYHSKPLSQRISEADQALQRHRDRDPESWPGGPPKYKKTEKKLEDIAAWVRTPEAEEASRRILAQLQSGVWR